MKIREGVVIVAVAWLGFFAARADAGSYLIDAGERVFRRLAPPDMESWFNGSRVSCSDTTETCAFLNVCGIKDVDGVRLYARKRPGDVAKYAELKTCAGIYWGSPYNFNVRVLDAGQMPGIREPDNIALEHRTSVLVELKSGENFGHHVSEIWFAAHAMLKLIAERFRPAEADKLNALRSVFYYPRSCTGLIGIFGNATAAERCEKLVEMFWRPAGFHGLLEFPARMTCFSRLVVGTGGFVAQRTRPWFQAEYEKYRDKIIHWHGLDPNAQPQGRNAVIISKNEGRNIERYTSAASHERLRDTLIASGRFDSVALVQRISDLPFRDQIALMLNASVVILPGGGISFISVFIAKGSSAYISAYPYDIEFNWFNPSACFSKIYLFALEKSAVPQHIITHILGRPSASQISPLKCNSP